MCNSMTRQTDWRNDDLFEDACNADTRRRVRERKTAQLCAQAQRALGSVIHNELLDADLGGLAVLDVRPHPDAGRLLVVLSGQQGCEFERAKQVLEGACGRLRQALGRAVSRKKVPLLSFAIIPEEGVSDE